MGKVVWNQPGERRYETGVDRGVLYTSSGNAVAWNGLTSVEISYEETESKRYVQDGLTMFGEQTPAEIKATVQAYTYPSEFEPYVGHASNDHFMVDAQAVHETFGFSYRSLIGSDESGTLHYKIHVLYNLSASPLDYTHTTIGDSVDLTDFGWEFSGVPVSLPGIRPSVHFWFDTSRMEEWVINHFENILYGSNTDPPRLPLPTEIFEVALATYDQSLYDATNTVLG